MSPPFTWKGLVPEADWMEELSDTGKSSFPFCPSPLSHFPLSRLSPCLGWVATAKSQFTAFQLWETKAALWSPAGPLITPGTMAWGTLTGGVHWNHIIGVGEKQFPKVGGLS